MRTIILSSAQVERLVDEEALVCAGCHEHVRADLPTADPAVGAEFFHRDGADKRGQARPGVRADRGHPMNGAAAEITRPTEGAMLGHTASPNDVDSREATVDTGPLSSYESEEVVVSVEPLHSLDRSTLREKALGALRAAITSGQYRPGDHLSEVELASHLGVSRGTVREALRHLQQEGLVTAGNRGMLRVTTVSPKEVRELFRVRAALEGLAAAEIIASPRRAAAVATLRTALDQLADTDGAAFAEKLESDLGFHLLLCSLSGNSMLVETWRHLEGRIRVTIMNGESDEAPTMMSRDRHAPIVDAIASGDISAASRVVEQHMAAAARQYAPADEDA